MRPFWLSESAVSDSSVVCIAKRTRSTTTSVVNARTEWTRTRFPPHDDDHKLVEYRGAGTAEAIFSASSFWTIPFLRLLRLRLLAPHRRIRILVLSISLSLKDLDKWTAIVRLIHPKSNPKARLNPRTRTKTRTNAKATVTKTSLLIRRSAKPKLFFNRIISNIGAVCFPLLVVFFCWCNKAMCFTKNFK